jgi:hypothetical protein
MVQKIYKKMKPLFCTSQICLFTTYFKTYHTQFLYFIITPEHTVFNMLHIPENLFINFSDSTRSEKFIKRFSGLICSRHPETPVCGSYIFLISEYDVLTLVMSLFASGIYRADPILNGLTTSRISWVAPYLPWQPMHTHHACGLVLVNSNVGTWAEWCCCCEPPNMGTGASYAEQVVASHARSCGGVTIHERRRVFIPWQIIGQAVICDSWLSTPCCEVSVRVWWFMFTLKTHIW